MKTKEIFQTYFQRKLIIWFGLVLLTTLIRLFNGHETSFSLFLLFILFIVVSTFIQGFIEYNFYEKYAPKVIGKLLNSEPILNFQGIGFLKNEKNKLEGCINNYKIILSPLTSMDGNKILTIFIPIQIKEGMDNYFIKYNDQFQFKISGNILFAEALIKNYQIDYSFEKLYEIIDNTTLSLIENEIKPLEIIDE